MDTPGVLQLITLVLLLILSSFFSSAETALSTVNRIRMRALEEDGNKRAVIVNRILDQYSKMISSILIGNNIVNITASSLLTTLVIRLTGGNTYVGAATGLLTVLVLLFGEIVPKNWAMINSEKISLAYCKIIYFLMKILTPVIFLVDKLAGGIMKLLHIDPNRKNVMTETELRTYVDVSHEDGVIESEEREIIYNVFDFSDAVAKDIMIPRINMVTVNIDASYDELMEVFRKSMYTRIPVYKEDQDTIVGLVNIKDFILTSDKNNFHIADIIRDAYYTYEFKKTADLMFEMREKTMNVAFVLNEYGATVGMITLEDLLEEIVGEIRDEYDEDEEELIQELDDNVYLVEGSMKLDDINDALDTQLESEDYDSIGGIIIESLDRLPEDGEEVTLENNITLKVQGIDQNRIMKVLMTLPEDTEETVPDEDEEEKTSGTDTGANP
ncbi:MAG: HlyC/CorC family transporter [Lachnospiraceae bacterium]|nr:HlyC/CorC family transporter [Lachnospiraceae bacterium]